MEITIKIYVYTYVTAFCQTDQTIQGYFEKFILYHIVLFFYIKLKTLNGLTTLARVVSIDIIKLKEIFTIESRSPRKPGACADI